MGTTTTDPYRLFARQVELDLTALADLLAELRGTPSSAGPAHIGAEFEGGLVRPDDTSLWRPAHGMSPVVRQLLDDSFTGELGSWQWELNPKPGLLDGAPFTALLQEVEGALSRLTAAATQYGLTPVMGPVPLRPTDLTRDHITPHPRYYQLDAALRRLREQHMGSPHFTLNLGDEGLVFESNTVASETLNLSSQVHLQPPPNLRIEDFLNTWAIVASAMLALSTNSPFVLGRRCGHETRLKVFEDATRTRPDLNRRIWPMNSWFSNVAEYFHLIAEFDVLIPEASDRPLDALRLANSTTWPWMRPILGHGNDGSFHVRAEERAHPAGPTLIDCIATLTVSACAALALTPNLAEVLPSLPYSIVKANLQEACHHGPNSTLWWPTRDGSSVEQVSARTLGDRLVTAAQEGFALHGVCSSELYLLDIVANRIATGQTGSVWQRRTVEALEAAGLGRWAAIDTMFAQYVELSAGGKPVSTWDISA